MIVGIDYGSKMAGTTVIARMYEHNKVDLQASAKNQDADKFISDFMEANQDIWLAYIDAPLSLPIAYKSLNGSNDYFYRQADRITGAMSPMFLGGLTARAMQLKEQISKKGIKVVETYPAKLAEVLSFKDEGYKKGKENINALCDRLKAESDFEFKNEDVLSWHHFDALLCLYSAK